MEYVIKGRRPESLFRFFEDISAIPRGSYNEQGIADYLVAFARERGLDVYRDQFHNVLIKKDATADRVGEAPVLLQGHTDMVCEKDANSAHDFTKDPLRLWVDGDMLRATGTTLGADNGVAVAIMLSLLDGEIPSHPPIECLFTSAEEVGMDGARGFDYSRIAARRMVNLDSEALGMITCGCVGGERAEMRMPFRSVPFAGQAVRVVIGGLMGGHSGENIHCGRANANKLMGRLLSTLSHEMEDLCLISVAGGSKENAIPRECEALISVGDFERADRILTEVGEAIAHELVEDDRGFSITVEDTESEPVMMSREDTLRAVAILCCPANGVLAMSRDREGLVEYSRNLGVVRTDAEELVVTFSSRSAMESRLDASAAELNALASLTNSTVIYYHRYPGWLFAKESPLRDAYSKAFLASTGRKAEIKLLHAGLECGVIKASIPDMDIIAIGPALFDLHSPQERLDLSSTELFWRTLEQLFTLL